MASETPSPGGAPEAVAARSGPRRHGSGILPEWDQDIQPRSRTYRRWVTAVVVAFGVLAVVLAVGLAVMIVE